jgi:hypothetical protein
MIEEFIGISEPQVLRPFHRSEALTVDEAALIAGRSPRTIKEWCQLHDIGRKVGGRWMVSSIALAMWLDGDRATLAWYLAGDRTTAIVTAYFERCGVPLIGRRTHQPVSIPGTMVIGSAHGT